jgi:hypothetical protein
MDISLAELEALRRKRREEREKKKGGVKEEPPKTVEVEGAPSYLKQLAMERELRSLGSERIEKRKKALELLKDLEEYIDSTIVELESEALRFGQAADSRDLDALGEIGSEIESSLSNIKESLEDSGRILGNLHPEDASWVKAQSFDPKAIPERVREIINLLKGVSEATTQVDLSKPGARKPIYQLNRIFEFATKYFGFPPTEIEIEMDTTRDSEIAKQLQESINSKPLSPPRQPSRSLTPYSERDIPLLNLNKALDIVESNRDVSIKDLRAILASKGFLEDVIDVVAPRVVVEGFKSPKKRVLPESFRMPLPEPEPLPVEEQREVVLYRLKQLGLSELRDIAIKYDLEIPARKGRIAMAKYLKNNMTLADLEKEIEIRKAKPPIAKNIPVIKPLS